MLSAKIKVFGFILQVLLISVLGVLLTLAVLVKPARSTPNVFYIDADYSGSEAGSETQPFNTIQEAHDASLDDVAEIFYIKAGTTNAYSHVDIIKGGVGPNAPDIYTIWPGTGSFPKISENVTSLIRINASYVTIDGLEVDGSAGSNTGDLIVSDSGVMAAFITIPNSKVHYSATDEGIQLKNAPNAMIENVESYHNAGDGINLCCGSDNSTVVYNYSHDNRGAGPPHGGFYFYHLTGLTMMNNISDNNHEAGIQFGGVTSSTIKNNLIISTTLSAGNGYGIWLQRTDGVQSSNNIITNNTVVNSAVDGINVAENTSNTTVIDNIVVSNGQYGIAAGAETANTVNHHNDVWNNTGGNWTGIVSGTGSLSLDPRFVPGPGPLGNYYLSQNDSPAVDAGSQPAINAGLSSFTTRPDQQEDQGVVDMGYHYSALPYSLTLAANPASIVANGLSTTALTVTVLTNNGAPVPDGTTVVFTSTLGQFSNLLPIFSASTAGGTAQAVLSSVPASDTVTAIVTADVYGASTETQILFSTPACGIDLTDWTEYATNPVFDPITNRAYYPTVSYDTGAFGHAAGDLISPSLAYTYTVTPYYKMWVATGQGGAGIQFAYSDDGITWQEFNNGQALPGLFASGYHSFVLYDQAGFGGTVNKYKIWYWRGDNIYYDISDMRYAESTDGITWENDQSLTQDAARPIIGPIGWNRGSYGPNHVFYDPDGSSTFDDANLWNNKYVMYYNGTDGGREYIGLGYSADGKLWKRYADNPLVPLGPAGAWDDYSLSYASVVRFSPTEYQMWYSASGGSGSTNHGIGYAVSSDGINWTKSVDNPIFHIDDGVAWRDSRTYTPVVLHNPTRFDGHGSPEQYKMWFTGRDSVSGNYAIGYATINPVHLASTSGSGQSGAVNSSLSQPFVAELHDSCNNPVGGINVTFAISDAPAGTSGQSLSAVGGITDGSGRVSTILTLGDQPGQYTVEAAAAGVVNLPVSFTATATSAPAPADDAIIFLPIVLKHSGWH